MKMSLPTDDSERPIPAMSLLDGGAHKINSGATAARNSQAFNLTSPDNSSYGVLSVYATQDIYIKFGGADVEATDEDHFFPAGLYYDFSLKPAHTHISVLRVTANGVVYLSEKY